MIAEYRRQFVLEVKSRLQESSESWVCREMCSLSLRALWSRGHQLGAENSVPEATCHAESVLEIGEVVLEVVLFEFLVVCGEAGGNLLVFISWG